METVVICLPARVVVFSGAKGILGFGEDWQGCSKILIDELKI